MRRTLFIGDVHGCNDEFGDLLAASGFGGDDRLVLVGDMTAKGPDSLGVVARARELKALAVLGNHDARVVELRDSDSKAPHAQIARALPAEDFRWLDLLPLWLDLPELNVLTVHAGVLAGIPLENQPRHVLLNLRSIDAEGRGSTRIENGVPWASKWPGPRHVIFGHDAVRGLQRYPFATGLDTGCVYGRSLTGLWLPEGRLVQVSARKAWMPIETKD
ncbi:MAG: metallophosphatase [Archangium gephyra]|uniref:Metallophosphatase n=1 Tax=Archangium gephyra TaxID=48 RepID=A0A2W5T054_9BACT|nr:MAG: metallophosphatase [Archangium gephyra]